MNVKTKITLLAAMFALAFTAGCSIDDSPVQPDIHKNIKTETKWLCNNLSGEKLYVVSKKTFDSNGNILSWEEFYDNGAYASKATYRYQGDITNIDKSFYSADGGVDSVRISRLSLNPEGKVVEKIVMDNNGHTLSVQTFQYDEAGNMTNKVTKNVSGSIESEVRYQYSYNNRGDVVARLQNPATDGSFQSKDSLIYYHDNRVDKISYSANGMIEAKTTYIYNTYGQIIEEAQSEAEGIVSRYLYEYTYF